MKKLFRLTQNVNNNYDTYDACIVCALSKKEALKIHPSEYAPDNWWECEHTYDWCEIKDVKIEYIGEAHEKIKLGIVLASFNAG